MVSKKISNSADYRNSLKQFHLNLYAFGEKIENVVDHPLFKPHINAVAATYDLSNDPEFEDLANAKSHLSGGSISRFNHIHQSREDLIKKVKMLRMLNQRTACCIQRCAGMDSANAAYSHALQWYVTDVKAHAEKVIAIFNAWSPVLQDFQQNDAKLLAGWTGYSFCNAAEILRCTDSGWAESDIAQFKKMLLGVYYPLLKDFFPEANGNWDAAIMSTILAMAIFCDDRSMFDRAVNHFIRGPLNGGITHYVYPSGQCQESTRDHAHTQLGLEWMAKAARIAWTQGTDLFGIADNRLALGFEYTAKHLSGEEVLAENNISPRERLQDIYLPAYQHYHFEKGLRMPFTALAVERTRDRASISLLTMYRGMDGHEPGSNPPVKREAPQPSPIAVQGGALREASAQPPADAVWVAPGQSIQAALDTTRRAGLVAEGLKHLPEKQRAALVLRDVEGLSSREVAAILGSSETTVRSQISTARVKLKKYMDRVLRRPQ